MSKRINTLICEKNPPALKISDTKQKNVSALNKVTSIVA